MAEFGTYQGFAFKAPFEQMAAVGEKKLNTLMQLKQRSDEAKQKFLEKLVVDEEMLPNHAQAMKGVIGDKRKEFYKLLQEHGNDMNRVLSSADAMSQLSQIEQDLTTHPILTANRTAKDMLKHLYPAMLNPEMQGLLPQNMGQIMESVVWGSPDAQGNRVYDFPVFGAKSNYDLAANLKPLVSYREDAVRNAYGTFESHKVPDVRESKSSMWDFVQTNEKARHIYQENIYPKVISNLGNLSTLAADPALQQTWGEKYGKELMEYIEPGFLAAEENKNITDKEAWEQYKQFSVGRDDPFGRAYGLMMRKQSEDALYELAPKEEQHKELKDPWWMRQNRQLQDWMRKQNITKTEAPNTWAQNMMIRQEMERRGINSFYQDRQYTTIQAAYDANDPDGKFRKSRTYGIGGLIMPNKVRLAAIRSVKQAGSRGNILASNNSGGWGVGADAIDPTEATLTYKGSFMAPWTTGASQHSQGLTLVDTSFQGWKALRKGQFDTPGVSIYANGVDDKKWLETMFPGLAIDKHNAIYEDIQWTPENKMLTKGDEEKMKRIKVDVVDDAGEIATTNLHEYLNNIGVVKSEPTLSYNQYRKEDVVGLQGAADALMQKHIDDTDPDALAEALEELYKEKGIKIQDVNFHRIAVDNPNYSMGLDVEETTSQQKTERQDMNPGSGGSMRIGWMEQGPDGNPLTTPAQGQQ